MSNTQEKSARKLLSAVPGLDLASGDSCVLDAEGHCITCSDEALPARVLRIDEALGTALVEVGDEPVEVDITLVDEVVPGNWLLVHGGVAIAAMDMPQDDGTQRVEGAGHGDGKRRHDYDAGNGPAPL